MDPSLPTADQINVFDSLDERVALERFLGKTLQQAEEMIREDSGRSAENLTFMGPEAFCFYMIAFVSFIKSASAPRDYSPVASLCYLVECRLDGDCNSIPCAISMMRDAVKYVLDNLDTYRLDSAIFGDMRQRLTLLLERLQQS